MSLRRIAIFTTSRAEFGILSPLIQQIKNTKGFQPLLFVGGAHLHKKYGKTLKEIEKYKFKIHSKFDYISNISGSQNLAASLGKATIQVSKIFKKFKFDYVCLLGDRYELISIVSNSILFKKPIMHIGGGDITSGSMDNQIRNLITKSSHLHFASCKEYKTNIINMSESAWRVHSVGSLSVDRILSMPRLNKSKIFKKFKLTKDLKTILMTYHPATLELDVSQSRQINQIFDALEKFNFQIVVTSPNDDVGRDKIVSLIKNRIKSKKNYHYFDTLNFEGYHNLLPFCELVIGNSSSGIYEAPFYKTPTINVGSRQKGRLMHKSVISTDYSELSIIQAIKKATSKKFKLKLKKMKYIYGDGNASKKIIKVLKKTQINRKLIQK